MMASPLPLLALSSDQNWSILLPTEPMFIPLSINSQRIRFHNCFTPQLYFESFAPTLPNKVLVTIAQALAGDNGKSVTLHTIFKKIVPISDNSFTHVCIDEVDHKLYLSFRGTKAHTDYTKIGQKIIYLAVLDIAFEEPDRCGYRRVTVDESSQKMYKLNFGMFKGITKFCIFLWPNIDNVLCKWRYYIGHPFDPESPQMNWFSEAIGMFNLNTAEKNTVDFGHIVSPKSDFLDLISSATLAGQTFLRQKKLVIIFSKQIHQHQPPSAKNCAVAMAYKIDQHHLHVGKDADLDAVFELHYDETELAEQLCEFKPKDNIVQYDHNSNIIDFIGRIFKYFLFRFPDGIAAVKHFEQSHLVKRYNPRTKEYLPQIDMHALFFTFLMVNPCSGDTTATNLSVLGSGLYYELVHKDQPRSTMYRLDLRMFNDYRTCANCTAIETRKRRNKQGKRISNFKVCRECKRLKLHHHWWKNACHFCSDKCMQNAWKKHRLIHDRGL